MRIIKTAQYSKIAQEWTQAEDASDTMPIPGAGSNDVEGWLGEILYGGDSDHRYAQNAITDEMPNDLEPETVTKKLIGLLNELKELDLQFANEVRFRETNQHLYDYISKKLSGIIGNLSYMVISQIGKN